MLDHYGSWAYQNGFYGIVFWHFVVCCVVVFFEKIKVTAISSFNFKSMFLPTRIKAILKKVTPYLCLYKHYFLCLVHKKQSIYVFLCSSTRKNFSSICRSHSVHKSVLISLFFFSMVETFFCSLLLSLKSYLYVSLILNNCYSKTECKYTKTFFFSSSFVKIFSIHFTIFVILK
jgi:hypothetical protein